MAIINFKSSYNGKDEVSLKFRSVSHIRKYDPENGWSKPTLAESMRRFMNTRDDTPYGDIDEIIHICDSIDNDIVNGLTIDIRKIRDLNRLE